MNHTPGPWHVEDDGYSAPMARRIAQAQLEGSEDHSLSRANAQLIAQAPALLEACEKALEWAQGIDHDDSRMPMDEHEGLMAVIAAATGEETPS